MNQENEDEVWTEQDEYMRMHAPILPPEVEMCWLCENKSVGKCEHCNNNVCQRHLLKCAVCHAKICVICCAGEEYGEAYCYDCCD